jgi:Prp8 binding protein
MSAEKRPADDDPGLSKVLVKRQNVNTSEGALARLNASSSALVQTVRWGFTVEALYGKVLIFL